MTVTELHAPETARVHTGRWQPSRAGIVNIWRYLDEVFAFHHGRLLLRGANGTGKSKALELLLPYLFDANLRAHRLSTFGSDRTMHWNLMGDGYPHATRVGYVWLEFARTDSDGERFVTCGARLQASTSSSSVSASYFLTTQRVGDGLLLLRDGRPLTRANLAEAIGGHGRVFEGATEEYRAAVRATLFPGVTREKYDALLVALLQLRTPKLSEHLNPDELSGLLSRSLPPVDADDVTEIAEGFERLDRHAEALETLAEETRAARRLADVARGYARRALRAAADRMIKATSAMDQVTRRARTSAEALGAARTERDGVTSSASQLGSERTGLAATAEGIRISDAYTEGRQIPTLRADAGTAARRAGAAETEARRAGAHAREDEVAAGAAGEKARSAEQQARRAGERAADAAEVVGRAALVAELAGTDDLRRARRLLAAGLDARRREIDRMQHALTAAAAARRDHRGAETRLETAREQHAAALEAATAAAEALTAAVTRLAEALVRWAGECTLLALPTDGLAACAADEAGVSTLVDDAATAVRERLTAAHTQRRADRETAAAERDAVAAERDAVAAQRDLPPPAPYTRAASRDGRAGAPLWRLVSFAEQVPDGDRARIEASLEAAALLDAWVLPDGSLFGVLADTFADAALGIPAPGASLADVLIVEPDAPVAAEHVTRLLAAVAYGPVAHGPGAPDHPAAIGADGSWRLGVARGAMTKPEPAYVGAAARERARARRLAELDEQLAGLDERLAELDAALAVIATQRTDLAAELGARPGHGEVRTAAAGRDRAVAAVAARADAVTSGEAEVTRFDGEVRTADTAVRQRAAELALPATESGLAGHRDALAGFDTAATTWLDERTAAAGSLRESELRAAQAQRSAGLAGEATERARELDTTAQQLAARLAAVEASVGVEFRELDAQLRVITDRIGAIDIEREGLRRRENELGEQIGGLREQSERDDADRTAAVADRDVAAEVLRRLAGGTLGADAQLDVELADGVTAMLAAARAVAEQVRDPFEERHLRAAQGRLAETVHEVRELLAGRADLQTEQGNDAVLLTATVDGRPVGAAALHRLLADEHAAASEALTGEERDLFDRTLTGDTRRHVAERIRTADDLVRSMNRKLGRVRTASRVRVQLSWQVDPELPPGTRAARDLLLRDPATLTADERDALHRFFRERVTEARDGGEAASWEAQLTQVFDYTAWHRFLVTVDLGDDGGQRQVTRKLHGTMSGGEKAIVLHLPLFAAIAAHYEASPTAPRLVLLDEVFVGIDPSNRGQLLDLIRGFDLDAVLTSDHEWCTYAELDGIAIHQLLTDETDRAVTTARFVWDGVALEQADLPEPEPESPESEVPESQPEPAAAGAPSLFDG